MTSPSDTQPRSPFKVPPTVEPDVNPYEQPPRARSGCLVYGLVGLMVIGFAGLIVALAAFAGWTTGQRVAQTNATATQNAVIADQLLRIPTDVSSNNQFLLSKRLEYLLTLTPGVQGIDALVQTATAVYENGLPSSTPLPTSTPLPLAATATPEPLIPAGSATPELSALFQQAQSAGAVADWDAAIDLLDAIMGLDPDFQTTAVRQAMLNALTKKALALYRSPDPSGLAEANQLTDRARQFGDVSEVEYESQIASLYLDAVNATGIDFNRSIRKLTELYNQTPGYRDVRQRLINEYINYGDTLVGAAQPCSAVGQYQNALAVQDDVTIIAKRDAAQTACTLQATQAFLTTPLPGTFQPVGVAPVGVPATPGG
ncbi:MAG: hypothetical protein R3E39_16210 [Anaerolineae bacterium]